ncbi:hypothetical protein AMTRI_Chr06g194840 [Amborella trichopoda]
MHPIPLSLNNTISKNHFLSLSKTRGPLSLTRAQFLPASSPSPTPSLSLYRCIHSSLSKPHTNKTHSLSLSKTRGPHENKNLFPLYLSQTTGALMHLLRLSLFIFFILKTL